MRGQPRRAESRPAAEWVRKRIQDGGERVWRHRDFADAPAAAVAQVLSRLAKAGALQRLSKGIYYRSRPTPFGSSVPNPTALRALAATERGIFPAGVAAANLLGFTTQSSGGVELSTSGFSLPRKLVGDSTRIHTRRPQAWASLSEEDAALLEFLRERGKTSELSPEETTRRVLTLFDAPHRFDRLLAVIATEPPRVRAMMGAIGEALGKNRRAVARIRASLNPLSRFDFGALTALPGAEQWQAKRPPT